ncbi:MAG: hypothetical protein HP497_12415 [Nitrospira sp.]|nr:hypothetical protein [Nitrospira sp.]
MLVRLKYPGAVWALVLCLVLVNAAMAAPSVAHAEHHGAHKAGTHATGICAWLCAAGQAVESSPVEFTSVLQAATCLVVSNSTDNFVLK